MGYGGVWVRLNKFHSSRACESVAYIVLTNSGTGKDSKDPVSLHIGTLMALFLTT